MSTKKASTFSKGPSQRAYGDLLKQHIVGVDLVAHVDLPGASGSDTIHKVNFGNKDVQMWADMKSRTLMITGTHRNGHERMTFQRVIPFELVKQFHYADVPFVREVPDDQGEDE